MTKLIVGVLVLATVGLGLYFVVISTIVRSGLYENSLNYLRNNSETFALQVENYFVDDGQLIETMEQAIARGEDRVRMPNVDGTYTYFIPISLDTTGWTLVTTVPASAVHAPVNTFIVMVLGWATFLLSCVIVAVIGYMAVLIKRAVQESVQAFQSASLALAHGEVIQKSNMKEDTSFGLHNISAEFDRNLGILSSLIQSISFVREEHLKGNYRASIDSNAYEGAFANVTSGINEVLAHHTSSKIEILDCISCIVDGDLDASIRQFHGEETYINMTVENLRKSMARIVELSVKMEKISTYQDNEAGDIAKNLQDKLDKGILQFAYETKIYDEDTAEAAASYKKIGDTMEHAVTFIKSYVDEINSVLASIAEGDLTSTITREYIGDFAVIKNSINNISTTLRKTMSEITTASNSVLEGANRITSKSTELAEGSNTQAVALEELNTSVELVNKQTQEFALNASEANLLSGKSTTNAQEGFKAMEQMVEAMTQIKDSSNSISKINKVIQDIAFQTSLLSLNAAVEAARAGDHGKGFGVVAEEVRSLSARSQAAAAETTELIQNSISRVESGVVIAQTTSDSLNTIVSNASEVLNLINNITKAANEQAEMVSQISKVLLYTANTVQDNSIFAHDAADTAQKLYSQSEMLTQLVSHFKL